MRELYALDLSTIGQKSVVQVSCKILRATHWEGRPRPIDTVVVTRHGYCLVQRVIVANFQEKTTLESTRSMLTVKEVSELLRVSRFTVSKPNQGGRDSCL